MPKWKPLSKFDKAVAAAVGGWLTVGLVALFEFVTSQDVPDSVEAWTTTMVVAGLTWLVPNA